MSWAIGYDEHWKRDIGYGVPAICDHPGCGASIDRGLAYVCGGQPYGGDNGCGLYFCCAHLLCDAYQSCERCVDGEAPFDPTPDTSEWMRHKLTDESWQAWRDDNPDEVSALQLALMRDEANQANAGRVSITKADTDALSLSAVGDEAHHDTEGQK